MSDYLTMQTRIQDELKRGNLSSQIQNAIISALRFYKRHKFRFNVARATADTTADIEYYGLPDDFIELDTMVLQEGQELVFMTERSHYWIDQEKGWADYRDRPRVYSVQADEFRLYPIPDGVYELTLTYHYELPEPSADTDTSSWFTDGEELIRTHAKVDILENIIRGPESLQEAQVLRLREQEVLKQLRIEYKRSQSSGTLTPTF